LLSGADDLRRGDFGGWDLPMFRYCSGKIRAAGIDDVLGVAAILAAITDAARRRLRTHLWGLFTRAEEVGFPGAIAAARSGRIPREALVLSLETSKERPWARIGDGPVVRVGDRTAMFDPSASWFLTETARRAGIRAQRCLMDGGTCEATAFAAHGYRVGGLCMALGNYHNIGPGRRPAAEWVSATDFAGLVALTVEAARQWPRFGAISGGLRQRVDRVYRSAPRSLSDP
jgi:endoglucanase